MSEMNLSQEEKELILKLRKAAQANGYVPVEADQVTMANKAAAFNRLHHMAMSIWTEAKETGFTNEDNPQYCYEAVMQLLVDPEDYRCNAFWDAFNGLSN